MFHTQKSKIYTKNDNISNLCEQALCNVRCKRGGEREREMCIGLNSSGKEKANVQNGPEDPSQGFPALDGVYLLHERWRLPREARSVAS